MSKLLIIYDSKTGYTETMAKTIAEGTKSVGGTTVILNKIGESTSPNILDGADIVAIGSPSHNGNVTLEMLVFLANLKQAIENGNISIDGKFGFAFGSYSWDGGICVEKLHNEMNNLGFIMDKKILAQINPIPNSTSKQQFLKECQDAGSKLAEKI